MVQPMKEPIADGKAILIFASFFAGTLCFVGLVYWWMFP